MARQKTANTPDLSVLLAPTSPMMLAVEQAVLRGHKSPAAVMPVADRIAVRIAGAITVNAIRSGQRLLETDISEVLQVSRAPVREALRILERERLVEFEARHGAIVTAPDAADLCDIYAVRSTLFELLLKHLMEQRPDDLKAVFDRHLPRIARAADEGSVDEYALQSFLLNLAMTDLSINRAIVDLLTSLALRTLRYVRLGLAADPGAMRQSLRSWRALQNAVATRNVSAVLETARQRISDSCDTAVRAIAAAEARPERRAPAPAPIAV